MEGESHLREQRKKFQNMEMQNCTRELGHCRPSAFWYPVPFGAWPRFFMILSCSSASLVSSHFINEEAKAKRRRRRAVCGRLA